MTTMMARDCKEKVIAVTVGKVLKKCVCLNFFRSISSNKIVQCE